MKAWVATRKGLFELELAAGAWRIARTSFLGEPVTQVLPPGSSGEPMIAALNLGHFGVKLQASYDQGLSWREVACPTFPVQPDGAAGAPWKLVQVWSMERGNGSLWAGTLPGGLFRSRDEGASWQLVESLWNRPERLAWFGGGYDVPGIHSICLHPQRPQELVLGISCGGVWYSHDDAKTWALRGSGLLASYMPPEQAADANIQDPHRLARCAAYPEVLWCQHHCGIWRSHDNAQSWQAVTTAPGSSFGFAVAAHPQNPLTAWFVPAVADEKRVPIDAALCVNRTVDGGVTFETFRAGLPQSDCYDLVYRHGLAVSQDGQHLLMGSTTGGVWASVDAGQTWQTVANRLQPIYSVRFE